MPAGLSVMFHQGGAMSRSYRKFEIEDGDLSYEEVRSHSQPKITWTFKDGSMVAPNFDDKTLSHMPKCDLSQQLPNACIGSGTYTHLGLNLVQSNIAAYKTECSKDMAPQPCNDQTEFINILVTDGVYQSTDAQVQAPLVAMFNAGITTYVIGFGDLVNTPAAIASLNKMADWGSGNAEDYYDANNQDALEASLKMILEQLTFDECCSFNDCSQIPEPTTEEPDPKVIDPMTTGDDTTTGEPATDTEMVSATEPDTTGDTEAQTSTTGATESTTTTNPTTESASDTTVTDPSAGDTTANPTGAPTTSGETPTTGGDDDGGNITATPGTTPATTADESESASSGGATDTSDMNTDDEGCGCTTDTEQGKTRGLLGTLLTFGLAGFMRRRRRAV